MPAKHRPDPKTRETIYRVYRMPEPLRKAMNQRRAQRGQTVQEFIQTAVADELSRLVGTLSSLGIKPPGVDARAAKLPLDNRLLGELKAASETTGVPQSQLLLSCIRISANRKRRASQRRGATQKRRANRKRRPSVRKN